MRNRDGFSAESETGSVAVPAPRSGFPLLLAPELPPGGRRSGNSDEQRDRSLPWR